MNRVFHLGNYNSPLPDIIYLDTSFIYEMYGDNPSNTYRQDCYNFSNRLATNGVIMAVSQLAIEELEHIIIKGIYSKWARQQNKRWETLLKETDKYMPEVVIELERVIGILQSNANVVECNVLMDSDFGIARRKLIANYALDTRDAGHVIVAHQNSTNSFATIDYDFHKIPQINIFSPNEKYFRAQGKQPNLLLPISTNIDDE